MYLSIQTKRIGLDRVLGESGSDGSFGFGRAYQVLESLAKNGTLGDCPSALNKLLARVESPRCLAMTFNPHPRNSLRVLRACAYLPSQFVHTVAIHLAAEGQCFEHSRCWLAATPYASPDLWRAMVAHFPSRKLVDTIAGLALGFDLDGVHDEWGPAVEDAFHGTVCSSKSARELVQQGGLLPEGQSYCTIHSGLGHRNLPRLRGVSEVDLHRSWLAYWSDADGKSKLGAIISKDGGDILWLSTTSGTR